MYSQRTNSELRNSLDSAGGQIWYDPESGDISKSSTCINLLYTSICWFLTFGYILLHFIDQYSHHIFSCEGGANPSVECNAGYSNANTGSTASLDCVVSFKFTAWCVQVSGPPPPPNNV